MNTLEEAQAYVDQVKEKIPPELRDIMTHVDAKFRAGEPLTSETVGEMRLEEMNFVLGVTLGIALTALKMAEMTDKKK